MSPAGKKRHRSPSKRRQQPRVLGNLLETLEPRQLLDAQSGGPGEVSAEWFASFTYGPRDLQLQQYEQATAVDRSWIVQLSETALDQLPSVADLPRMLWDAQLPVLAVRGLGLPGQLLVQAKGNAAAAEAALRASPLIAQSHENGVLEAQQVPNDPKFSQQFALSNSKDIDIDAPEAWDISRGSRKVVVAVIDSGIDYHHPDLANNVWVNPGEIPGNGIDDDQNGFIDDVRGFDFANGDSVPLDDNGHGTNVAGIIGAVGNNKQGIAGVNWYSSMMPLKHLNQDNVGTRDNAVTAINYATMMRQRGVNLQVINASWGDYGDFYQPMHDAIKAAGDAGILFVAAAGNGNSLGRGIDLDRERTPFYPASYDLDTIISVGAAAEDRSLAAFSNYGAKSVDLLAPGVGILTTDRASLYNDVNNAYALRNGTSFAAPFVTGVAALVAATKPGTPVSELREAILSSVEQSPTLGSIVASSGRLNAHGALTADAFAPRALAGAISNRSAPGTVTINVTYTSDVDLALASIDGSEIQVNRVGFQGKSQIAALVPGSKVVVSSKQITAAYRITIADSRDNGNYQVVLRGNRVRNVNGLAAAERVLRSFKVDISDPNLLVVNSKQDIPLDRLAAGQMTLRAAVQTANQMSGLQRILLPDGDYLLSEGGATARAEHLSAKGDLDIIDHIEIIGSGSAFNTIDGQGIDRVFQVIHTGRLDLYDVTIAGGAETVGAGIFNDGILFMQRSTVKQSIANIRGGGIANVKGAIGELRDSTVEGNSTTNRTTPLGGGGIYNAGELLISRSTISNNSSVAGFTTFGGGGGLFNDASGVLRVFSSTFSGNAAAQGRGGGIYNDGTIVRIQRATIVNNRAVRTGGIFNVAGKSVTIKGSVIASSVGGINDTEGAFNSEGYNFVGLASLSTTGFNPSTDQIQPESSTPVDPKLGSLSDNGGLTKTHVPDADSPLIDGITDTTTSFDQLLRPVALSFADIGALERVDSLVSGRIFNDLDGDGVFDSEDAGLAGVTVFIDLNGNSILDQGEPTALSAVDDPATPTTVETGNYRFILPPFTNAPVAIVTPEGFSPTSFRSLPVSSPVVLTKLADTSSGINGLGAGSFSDPLFAAVDADGSVAFSAKSASGQVTYFIGKDGFFSTVPVVGDRGHDDSQLEDGRLAFTTTGSFTYDGKTYLRGVYLREANGGLQKIADVNTLVPGETSSFGNISFMEPRLSNGIVLFHTELASAPPPQGAVYASAGSGNLRSDAVGLTGLFRVDNLSGDANRGDRFFDADIDGYNYTFVTPLGIWVRGDASTTGNIVPHGSDIPGGGLFDFSKPSALAIAQGVVSFLARGDGSQAGVYQYKSGSVQVLADLNTTIPGRSQKFTGFGAELTAEGNATVFLGQGANGFRGIYASIGGKLRKIVDTTDRVQGSRIVGVNLGSDALSENRIGFIATLADGRKVVMLATLPFDSQQPLDFTSIGQDLLDKNFGLQGLPGILRGNVFEDLDADTIPDASDKPLANWTVFLDQNNNQRLDSGERSVVTNALGDYVFSNLAASQTYFVRVQVPSNFNRIFPTNADDGQWSVNLSPGETRDGLDFATVRTGGSSGVGTASLLKGRIYGDANNNKKFDAGEGRVGWTVFIDANDNGFLDANERSTRTMADNPATTANEAGLYEFANLAAGTYKVRTLLPSGSSQVTPLSNRLTQRAPVSTVRAPSALAIGNFDKAKGPDLVVVSNGQNSASISLNSGNGVFGSPLTLSNIGSSPSAVAVGDINGDGRQDIVIANQYGNALSVLFNNGSAGVPFSRANLVQFPAGGSLGYANARGLVIADFNGDGRLDVATANDLVANNVTIYLNSATSQGSLVRSQSLSAGTHAFAIAALDLDGDSDLDLVISNYLDGTIRLLRNNGAGVFSVVGSPIRVGSAPSSIAVGNFDKKGGLDIAVANYSSNNVSILLSNGNFTFTAPRSVAVPAGATSIVADDIDADGDTDLIVAAGQTGATGGVSILRNRGNGRFGAAETRGVGFLGGVASFNVAAGKMDADNTLDLVVTDGFQSNFSLLTNEILEEGGHQVELLTGLEAVFGLDFLVKQQPTQAPTGVDLLPAFDSGSSNSDNLTNRNNNGTAKRLQFRVSGTVAGAVVRLYAGEKFIGSATASGTSTVVTTNGKAVIANGAHNIGARQQSPGKAQSFRSPTLKVTIDTVAPGKPGLPDLVFASDNGSSGTDNITSLTTLSFTGKAAANTRVRLIRNGVGVATADVNSAGVYLVAVGGFTRATHSITVKAFDAAGNFSVASSALTVQVVASAAIPAATAPVSQSPIAPPTPNSTDSQDALFTQLAEEGWDTLSG